MKSNKHVYWLLSTVYDNDVRRYQIRFSYDDRLDKIKQMIKKALPLNPYAPIPLDPHAAINLVYSRGEGIDNIVIDDEDSLRLTYKFIGEDLFDIKKGLVVHLV